MVLQLGFPGVSSQINIDLPDLLEFCCYEHEIM